MAGANQDDYLVQGYAESPDGRTNWSEHQIVFAPEERVFDVCVIAAKDGYETVFSRVNVSNADLPLTGLWWCQGTTPSPNMADWSKPVLCYGETDPNTMFVFCDGAYLKASPVGIPFHFTLDCIQIARPATPDGEQGQREEENKS